MRESGKRVTVGLGDLGESLEVQYDPAARLDLRARRTTVVRKELRDRYSVEVRQLREPSNRYVAVPSLVGAYNRCFPLAVGSCLDVLEGHTLLYTDLAEALSEGLGVLVAHRGSHSSL